MMTEKRGSLRIKSGSTYLLAWKIPSDLEGQLFGGYPKVAA
jgi:hypothetical protein